ncbi:MAG: hypothetical protein RBT76_09780 [candidate division Zixibacteria bacterium]|jgi:hypothetical protein|nr:hypothetical protein [candidate division Zixibacteria bacterium]
MRTAAPHTTVDITSAGSSAVFTPDSVFDPSARRHLVCEQPTVIHCHHYATLFTQMATDAEHLGGPVHLIDAAAEALYPILKRYMVLHKLVRLNDRLAVAEQYFSFSGLGQIRFSCRPGEALVTMARSHIDDGWLRRWGPRDKPVNFIGLGFIKATLAAVFDLDDWHDVNVTEHKSIVCGAPHSEFLAAWRTATDGA